MTIYKITYKIEEVRKYIESLCESTSLTRQQIQAVSECDKGKTINCNIRVYEKEYEVFTIWCKTNDVTKADALYKAISLLMQDN